MADIGVLPSRTAVQITSSNGENGTIPAATPRAAGVMTAEHARQLAELYERSQLDDQGSAPIIIERQAPDAISRAEHGAALRAALSEMHRLVAANQAPVPLLPPDSGIAERISALESRVALQDDRMRTIAATVDAALSVMEQIEQAQQFVEKNAVARVALEAA